ncbi:uncharacterized protein [Macrobrachium rosenbergii]|uniref:uncharacterized protein n=1 Tax=Macrobrachium rosenbergii TaxID=79674 RepID=UPI0034D688C1
MAPVEQVKTTRDGHLFVRFPDRKNLEMAKMEIQAISNISANEKGTLKPKIKVVYVPKDEDDIVANIVKKNPWINNLISENDDLKIVKEMAAKNDKYKPYTVSSNAHHKHEKLSMIEVIEYLHCIYSRCKVFACYMPYQRYKCQEFGHSATDCRNDQACPRCGENHKSNECASSIFRCKNCLKKGHSNTKHKTYDGNKCTV